MELARFWGVADNGEAIEVAVASPLVDQLFRSNIPHVYLIAEGISAAYRLPMDAFTPRGRDLVAAASKSCILEVFKETAASPAPGARSSNS